MHFKLWGILLLSFFTNCLFSQINTIDTAIKKVKDKYNAIGVSIVVVKDNKIAFQKNYGYKNLTTKTPLENNDLFRIASISKSFTATSLMQIIASGKCSLDEDFSNLIGFRIRNPKFPDKKITLRMVLSHTSSISDRNGYFDLDVINPDKNSDWAKCYNDYAPGTEYQYCNLNFNMAGTVLEKLSGERFDQYIVHHVLQPLSLYGGYCVDSLDNAKFVPLYEWSDSLHQYTEQISAYEPRSAAIAQYKLGYSTPLFSPTGGMKISALDLARYMMMHMNDGKLNDIRIIKKKYAKKMQTPVNIKAQYGLAIEKSRYIVEGIELTGHEGSAYGLHSAMYFNPQKKYGFVVITNGCQTIDTDDLNPFLKDCINVLYQSFIAQ